MNITVMGASKGTGARVVARAAADRHCVVAFSRSRPSGSDAAGVTWITGDALDLEAVSRAVRGADAVVVTLGAPARDTSGLRAQATAVIVAAMRQERVERLVVQSSLGVGDSEVLLPWAMKHLVVPVLLKRAFADHLDQERVVRDSGLDWTIVRPGHLTDRDPGPYVAGFTSPDRILTGSVARADVADFIVRSLGDPASSRTALALSGTR